jgi:steroid 5-alpha reductase family enzyme
MRLKPSEVLATPATIAIAAAVAWAGSQGSARVGQVPMFAVAVVLAFLVQIAAFVPAYLMQTERFYDLTGSLTYVVVTVLTALLSRPLDARSLLLAALVIVWAARLGFFLFRRVLKAGKDSRFDEIKTSFVKYLNAWTIQGLWITLTAGAALAGISSTTRVPLDAWAAVGLAVWLAGFAIESVADAQKNQFRADPANKGRFIHAGLWSWSRHPNYFGEITLWTGVALIALPALRGWQLATLVSPLFVFLLITRVSGVPILERQADERWGGQQDYEEYKSRTSVLVPLPPRKRGR